MPLEAVTPPEPEPAAEPDEPLALRLDYADLDAGDLEDIATYAGRDDVIALIMDAFEKAANAEPGAQLKTLFKALPPRVFTGLLGVARRRVDPGWTPEHWRKFRFADLAGPGDGMDPTPAGPTPGSSPPDSPNESPTRPSGPTSAGRPSGATRS